MFFGIKWIVFILSVNKTHCFF